MLKFKQKRLFCVLNFDKIDKHIDADPMEIDIRAATVVCVEELKKLIKEKDPEKEYIFIIIQIY